MPFVAVGLLCGGATSSRRSTSRGAAAHLPRARHHPAPYPTSGEQHGGQCKVPIEFPGRTVLDGLCAPGRAGPPIILLDTDIADNEPADRPITHTLYIRGREMRFCQDLVLGVGAVRLLAAQSIEPAVWHVNEGHAA